MTENTTQSPDEIPMVRGRTGARLAAIQALYQIDMEPTAPEIVIGQFTAFRFTQPEKFHILKPDDTLFRQIVMGVCASQEQLDVRIQGVLSQGWTVDRLETVIRAILRAALYELTEHPETPKVVVINEYVNLTKAFYSGQEPGFVNASLDRLSNQTSIGENSENP